MQKNLMVILGDSFLNTEICKYLCFIHLKDFLLKNNKFTDQWNPLKYYQLMRQLLEI